MHHAGLVSYPRIAAVAVERPYKYGGWAGGRGYSASRHNPDYNLTV